MNFKLDEGLILILAPAFSLLFFRVNSRQQQFKIFENVFKWFLFFFQENIKEFFDDRRREKVVNLSFEIVKIFAVWLFGTVENLLQENTNSLIQFWIMFVFNKVLNNFLYDLFFEVFVFVLFVSILTHNDLAQQITYGRVA